MPNFEHICKFLSFVLRHKPESINITLNSNGWTSIDSLIENANQIEHMNLTYELVEEVVRTNDKKRFSISIDGSMIRANQGHSISINLDLEPVVPPDILYHGTATRFLENIKISGLKPMSRQYVHLSDAEETARKVGARHGSPAILNINSKQMHLDGYIFYLSENKVWLTNEVPSTYINFN